MKKVLYFAYGSNLSIDRLEFRVGLVKAVRPHKLYGWKLVFNTTEFYRPYANIEKGLPTDFVEGVLYDLTPHQLTILSKYEGLYDRFYFDLPGGELLCAYISTDPRYYTEEKPELGYLNVIIEGCKEFNLTHTYEKLVAYKLKNYRLKKSKH